MNELAKKNIECLAEKMKDIEGGIENYVNKNGNQDKTVYIDRSANEELILAKEKEGRMWYLNSRYNARHAAKYLRMHRVRFITEIYSFCVALVMECTCRNF